MNQKLTAPVLVVTDHTGDTENGFVLTAPSAQLLTMARQITAGPIYAVALNPAPALDDLSRLGVSQVLIPDLAGLSPRIPAVVSDAVLACLKQVPEVAAVLCVSNYRGREVTARLAIKLESGGAVDVIAMAVNEGDIVVKKSVLSSSWETTFQVTKGIPVFAVRPSSIAAEDAPEPTSPSVKPVSVEFSQVAKSIQVVSSREQQTSGRVPLSEATVVVCGGRGTDGDFTLVEDLADQLGGAVGATRVATDEGWVDRSLQIGQTGITVAPQVYVGLGVSGAVHHTCGMQSSQYVVAVCDDPDAPIFEMCDFGVVGDINEVVPAALEALREQN